MIKILKKILDILILLNKNKKTVISKKKPKSKLKKGNMQEVTLIREILSNKATLGIMYIGGKEVCRTLENPWLDNKTDISCIPVGQYEVAKDDTGKFKYWRIKDVPNRSLVEIHNGNIERHTKGCILIGSEWGQVEGQIAVVNSLKTLKKLRKILDDKFIINIKE